MTSSPSPATSSGRWAVRLAGWLVLLAILAWAYAPSTWMLVGRWWAEPDYVYGFLVPPFSVLLLWMRREQRPVEAARGSLWGLAFLAICGVMRAASAYFYFELFEPLSLVPCLAGIALLLGGWRTLYWAWPAIVYLLFMVPLPGFLATMLSLPLQQIGATTSAYLLQTMGIPAQVHVNVISLSRWELGVEEACSGLRMLMLFFAVCVGAAFVMQRPAWEKLVLVFSAIPIAVIANVARITLTGVLYEIAGPELAEAVFHALAGWFMMPLAVILLWMEMMLLSLLFHPTLEEEPVWE